VQAEESKPTLALKACTRQFGADLARREHRRLRDYQRRDTSGSQGQQQQGPPAGQLSACEA
jgi:hypothetical protein